MTDQDDARSALFFLLKKAASKLRTYSQSRQKIPRGYLRVDLNRAIEASHCVLSVVVGNQMFECVVLGSPVHEIGITAIEGFEIVGFYRLCIDQRLRLGVGQRMQHDSIDHAEYGSVGSNTRSQ